MTNTTRQAVKDDGSAVLKLVVNRERFNHRSPSVKIDYDSRNDGSFAPTEAELNEIADFVDMMRLVHEQEYVFEFSDRGKIRRFEEHEYMPGQLIAWPELPEHSVGVGDSWAGVTMDGQDVEYKFVKLNEIDGHTVAWIEHESDTMRCRFLVDEGRYLDHVNWDIFRIEQSDGGL